MVGTLTLRCIKLPHYVKARGPGERYTISPICVRSGAPAAERFPFFDVSKQLIQLATLLTFENPADDDLIQFLRLVPSITPASQTSEYAFCNLTLSMDLREFIWQKSSAIAETVWRAMSVQVIAHFWCLQFSLCDVATVVTIRYCAEYQVNAAVERWCFTYDRFTINVRVHVAKRLIV